MLYIYSRSPRELSKALARPWGRSDALRVKRERIAAAAEAEKTAAYRAKLTRKPVESSGRKSAALTCGVINEDAVEGVAKFAEALRKLQVGEPLTAEEKAIPGLPDLARYPGHPQPAKSAQKQVIWDLVAKLGETAAELERVKQQLKDARDGIKMLQAIVENDTRERDELLAALKLGTKLQGEGDIWSVNPGKMSAFQNVAKVAIANAEGRAG